MNTVIIVQARMTSSRLPGKVLKKVMDKTLLEYQIERLRRVRSANGLVVATTTNSSDEPIIEECGRLGINVFRGSEEDVLSRYYTAASEFGASDVVRVTSDCPLIDPEIMDKVIQYYQQNRNKFDYVSNTLERTYPRGMDTEVFSFKVLKEAFQEAKSQSEREHVTPFFYRNPHRFRLASVRYNGDESRHRWTVDTQEDFELISNIITAIYPQNPCFNMNDTLELLHEHSEWILINAMVEQKKTDS